MRSRCRACIQSSGRGVFVAIGPGLRISFIPRNHLVTVLNSQTNSSIGVLVLEDNIRWTLAASTSTQGGQYGAYDAERTLQSIQYRVYRT
jgi:hypothetical protein